MHMVLRRERIKKSLSRVQWDMARQLLKFACDPAVSQTEIEQLVQVASQPGFFESSLHILSSIFCFVYGFAFHYSHTFNVWI